MTIHTAWRIVKERRASGSVQIQGVALPAAFDGEGARRYPGRWNNRGTPMVYTSSSQSLAILEILVHAESESLLESYCVFSVTFADKYLRDADNTYGLPGDWQENPPRQAARQLGDAWVASLETPVLSVPSAIVPSEYNYLINPFHPNITQLSFGEPQSLQMDDRLK